ncbi:HlyD family type I secretion periplasmic adaptor subunit [Rhizobium sp. CB3060]|uniref:HlyD family type I secretion periplasmic adaptor subunit n=1 Tax=Rhizobium sp. CB3060 TaxID=3138255 RepID=UPI0021A42344|nr:HlyD family type I secretion periplasmic adaptor subunit [Rhizobium tropici]UWU23036.1 HlyD family type I secretion periplasmic adaptor subunit [Rhizobium tropici]
MNQFIKPPKRPRRPRRTRIENEFLPAALEILETPASPIRTVFIWFIAVVVGSTLLWSYLGTFDIVSTAQGKLQPTGRVKVIQSLEVGKTRSIPVVNGSKVKAGDVVVELDDTELKSDEEALTVNLHALRAEIARRNIALALVRSWLAGDIWTCDRTIPATLLSLPADTPDNIRTREQTIFAADLAQLDANLDNLAAQRTQQQATIERLSAKIDAHKRLIGTLAERVAMRSTLVDEAAGSKSGVIDALEIQQKEETDLAEEVGQLAEARAALAVATSEGEKALRAFIADNAEKLGDASKQADELDKQLIKAQTRRQSMTIESPIDGVVTASAITTIGQVVNPGSELMRVVPADTALEIEAFLPNSDIGFVAAGQEAVIKVQAFPFTRYGVVHGHVTSVATDAVPEPDAQQMEGEPAKQLQSLIPIGNVQRVQNLVFPVTVRPDTDVINVDGVMQPLSPGMAATVEIKTGKRRILEYLFSPLAEVASEAMQER